MKFTRTLPLLGAFSLVSLPLAAQAADPRVAAAVERLTPRITEIRHDLHQHPELSNREVRTAGLVAEHLRSLGMEERTGIAHTGVVGILRGGRPGHTIDIREDIGARPVSVGPPSLCASTDR